MKLVLDWQENVATQVTTTGGHIVKMDGIESVGGRNQGTRPMEIILCGLMGCTSIDIVHILNKMKQTFDDFKIIAHAERSETLPAVFTKINLEFVFYGANLDPESIHRAVSLSNEKYCSVSTMLKPKVTIEWKVTLLPNKS